LKKKKTLLLTMNKGEEEKKHLRAYERKKAKIYFTKKYFTYTTKSYYINV